MMKMLTYSGMAAARLRANRRSYASLLLGIFLSVFLISTFVLGVYGIVAARQWSRREKVGNLDMVVLDSDQITDEKILALGDFDRLGHAYMTGAVAQTNLYLGYYDEVGASLLELSPTDGRMPEAAGEIAVEPSALEVLDQTLILGDTVELSIVPVDGLEEQRLFTIVGFLPEKSTHLGVTDFNGIKQFPAIVTSSSEPAFATGRVGSHRMMGLKNGVSLTQGINHFWEKYQGPGLISSMYGLTISAKQVQYYSPGEFWYVEREIVSLIGMAAVLAATLILSCGVGISGAMEGVLSKRREEIGVLRALGATRCQIRRMFGRENLILALVVSPISFAAGCVAVWILSMMMPDLVHFAVKLWLLIPVVLFSILVILIAGYLPLVRASKLMPMSVIRDTQMLRRSKTVKTRKVFSAPRLIASRQIRLNPTRQIGASLLVGLMLLSCALLVSMISHYNNYTISDYPAFRIHDNGASSGHPVCTYTSEPMSPQSIRQIRSLDHVESITIDREIPICVELDHVPRYAMLNGIIDQYWMLDDAMFAEAMAALGEDNWWYLNSRDRTRAEYQDFRKTYGFQGEAFQTSIVTIEPTRENLAKLEAKLGEGTIDVAALDSGTQVLVYAPDIWFKQHEHGSYSLHTSEESLKNDPYDGYVSITAKNQSFHAGQTLSLTQLFRTEENGPVTQIEKAVQVGGIIKEIDLAQIDLWGLTAIITTEQGLENMGIRMDDLHTISIYTDDNLTLDQEEILNRQLTAISRRAEGYAVENQAEEFRKIRQEDQRQMLVFLCVITVFFSVAVGMIVSSVTRQLNTEGRTIGMLRAVGADEEAILGCFSGQLNAAIFGGLGFIAALGSIYLVFSILDMLHNPFLRFSLWDLIQWVGVSGIILGMAAACYLLSRFILRLRVREILKKSIIDNIREL